MKRILQIIGNVLGLDLIAEGFVTMRREVLPIFFRSLRLSLSKKGRKVLYDSYQKRQERIGNQPHLIFITRWFPRIYGFMALLMVSYVFMHFFLLQSISIWPLDLVMGLAIISMAWMLAIIAPLAIPAFRHSKS